MANPPTLTPEQRQLALEKAAVARRQRAEVKDKLKIGSLTFARAVRSRRPRRRVGRHARQAQGRERARVAPGCRQGARSSHHVGARDLREPPPRAGWAPTSGGRCSRSLPAETNDPAPGNDRTRRGVLLVLAGTSGAGKGTIGNRLRESDPGLGWSVSWTTRAPRATEREGVDYHFVTRRRVRAAA